MFKAAPRGAVWRELTADPLIPEWMHVQTQCKGSYRAQDMVELLEKTLSPAADDCDSAVVCLDWFAAHRDASVVEAIESRGYVQLMLCGGTTSIEQVYDTNLHATLQARMNDLADVD